MFLDFFLLLKNDGIPVTIREYLTFLEALDKDVVEYSVDDFYFLGRTSLIKHEHHLDRFDLLFGYFFEGIEKIDMEEFMKIPEEWLKKSFVNKLTDEDKEMIKAMGGLDKLLERLKELMKTQKKRHQGGNKWIGTGGTSPYGAYGFNPEGIRIGQEESRNRRAIKVWDKREFKDLDDGVELETRNMKMALRRLRILTREGTKEELDLDKTIDKTSRNGGLLELEMVAAKKNNVKVLLFLDIGGSMDDHIELCSRLFSAAKYEFKHLENYYFHNCLYESVWKDNVRRRQEAIPTFEVLHTYNSDYKVIIVGDASMSPYELLYQNGSVEHDNDEAGFVWLDRLKDQFSDMVWLNPVPVDEWRYTESIGMVREFMKDRMFPLTMGGLQQAIKALKDKKVKFEGH
ncbi:MAG: VWA domain-containing protein [Candidatus Dadabacteria bacterium]|nr:MAG: VWA domain-containing protein [Candidatus Dadabacteria bacterium]TDI98714.1 MAG: VWA domain-containing protein [Candidatus Dadabacteria bacterium]